MRNIRKAQDNDWERIWPIFHEVVRAGDTYAYDSNTSKDRGRVLWLDNPRETFVVEDSGDIVGTYYIKTNQSGPGSHVCNCGYMVASTARGKGVATTMCEHSQKRARDLGYLAMQFNFVAASNQGALALWHTLGFDTVGTLPKAFNHPRDGLIDAYVMYKTL